MTRFFFFFFFSILLPSRQLEQKKNVSSHPVGHTETNKVFEDSYCCAAETTSFFALIKIWKTLLYATLITDIWTGSDRNSVHRSTVCSCHSWWAQSKKKGEKGWFKVETIQKEGSEKVLFLSFQHMPAELSAACTNSGNSCRLNRHKCPSHFSGTMHHVSRK